MNEAPHLHHEQLDAYKAAIEFLALATTILAGYPKGSGVLTDQLRRASLSIPLNIAEGYGRRTTPDRSKFYGIARGSAHECGALLDASAILKLVDEEHFLRGKILLVRTGVDGVQFAGRSPRRTTEPKAE